MPWHILKESGGDPTTPRLMNFWTTSNIQRLSVEVLLNNFEDFDRTRRTAHKQETINKAIDCMNLISEELDRREA